MTLTGNSPEQEAKRELEKGHWLVAPHGSENACIGSMQFGVWIMEEDERDLRDRISRLEAALAQTDRRTRDLEIALGQVWAARTPTPRTAAPPVAAPSTGGPVRSESKEPTAPETVSSPGPPVLPQPDRVFHFPELSSELEVVIGTSWLNRLGIVAILAAVVYFLKYSFDNNWIGPTGRVGLTLLLGLGLLLAGERYQRRRLATFAQGLSGGGVAVLYFSMYAGFAIYHVIGFAPAFATLVLITISAALLADRYDSIVIAVLGLFGGFATPMALGGDGTGAGGAARTPVSAGLYLYFLLLNAGMYVLARRKGWWKFGGLGLIAGFLAPVIVATSALPDPSAAGVYFLVLSLATLVLSLSLAVPLLAWAALVGGFLMSHLGGAGALLERHTLFALGYYGVITVAAVLVAERHNWRGVAVAASIAGSMVMWTARLLPAANFLYLAVVGGASLFATIRRQWRWSDMIALLATGASGALIASDIGSSQIATTLVLLSGATLLFLLFSITAALESRRQTEHRLQTMIVAAAVYAGQLFLILGPERRDALALAAVALAIYHLVVSRVLLARAFPSLTILVLLGLAMTAVTIAIPIKLRQEAIPLAWAVEGAGLAWAATRARNVWAGRAAALVGLLVTLRLVIVETPAIASARLMVSAPGLAFLAGIISLVIGGGFLRTLPWETEHDRHLAPGLYALAAGLLLWWGGWEIDGAYGRGGGGAFASGAKQATLSAWFTLYGFGLIVTGVIKNVALVRWAGIGLLGITILKVFVMDLAEVQVVFRILSLAVLGMLLLLASLVYNRYRARLSGSPHAPGGQP